MNSTFVFVHGSNCNSFVWGPLQRELALLGRRTLAVDLPGHCLAAAFTAKRRRTARIAEVDRTNLDRRRRRRSRLTGN